VILDIFSRFVVGWLIALRESADLAQQLIAQTVALHDIIRGTLTLHADPGGSAFCEHRWVRFGERQREDVYPVYELVKANQAALNRLEL
jgi:transposase InsO family protein